VLLDPKNRSGRLPLPAWSDRIGRR
jgi:hypothetical protein